MLPLRFVTVVRALLLLAIVGTTVQGPCYVLKMLEYRWTETPNYRLSMRLYDNQTLSSVTTVLKEVTVPMWNFVIVQHNRKRNSLGKVEAPKILYNATYKICEFWRYVKRVRVFYNVAQLLLNKKNGGNMSLECPLSTGTYVLRNIHVPPDTGFLKFMYAPNSVYSLYGTVYSQSPDKTMQKLSSYDINGTILKYC